MDFDRTRKNTEKITRLFKGEFKDILFVAEHFYKKPKNFPPHLLNSFSFKQRLSDTIQTFEQRDTSKDCFVPMVSTSNGTDMFPASLGCETFMVNKNKRWIKKCVFSPKDVAKIKIRDVYNGICGDVLRWTEYLAENIPNGYYIRQTDIQSPFGVANLMWEDSNFFISLYDNPNAVKDLLETITEFIIAFIKKQRSISSKVHAPAFPKVWCPKDVGTYISDDNLALVNPEMHLEFSVPYINRISKECGGLAYHSCAIKEEHYVVIDQIQDIKIINWNGGDSSCFAENVEHFSKKGIVVAPHIYPAIHQTKGMHPHYFKDEWEVLDYIFKSIDDNTRMFLSIGNIDGHEAFGYNTLDADRLYKYFDEREIR